MTNLDFFVDLYYNKKCLLETAGVRSHKTPVFQKEYKCI